MTDAQRLLDAAMSLIGAALLLGAAIALLMAPAAELVPAHPILARVAQGLVAMLVFAASGTCVAFAVIQLRAFARR